MSLDTFHFETLSKTVYSHGLEAIYALETVDIRTLKRMEEPKKSLPVPKVKFETFGEELPLDPPFRATLPSTLLSLPIDCLEISKPLVLRLKERGVFLASDLIEYRKTLFKGMGLNDTEELKRCFEKTFKGKELNFCQTIDWVSFLKAALFPIDKRGGLFALTRIWD